MGAHEVRAAAKAILDRESIRFFGKPFDKVVPLADLEQIKRKDEEYLDSVRETDNFHEWRN